VRFAVKWSGNALRGGSAFNSPDEPSAAWLPRSLAFAAENSDEGKTGQSEVAFDPVVMFMTRAGGRWNGFRVGRNEGELHRIGLVRNFRPLRNQRESQDQENGRGGGFKHV
jgi:hypothetical protein